ncbi:GNAT family N-acetyltransferase [Priestia koreensis]|uniref:GNAT family N-acetyltransferase n=1 Tax=Priestia koreensis TaxID=284581 RepID=UPI00345A8DCB
MFNYVIDNEISLRLIQKEDAEELFNLMNRSRDYLREWLPWVDNMTCPEDYHGIIAIWLDQFTNNDGFQAAISYNGQIVGLAGFHALDWQNHKTTIGYWLGEGFQGKGIMTRVVSGMLRYAFEEYGLNRVEIRCGVHNHKSRAIPERLGLVQEGIIRDGEYLYDHFHDLVVYGILAREWDERVKTQERA